MSAAREDYCQYLQEIGMTEAEVQKIVQRDDLIPFPPEVQLVEVRESRIAGRGLFITDSVYPGQLLAPARLAGKRTPAGRFTNHDCHPNCLMVPLDGDLFLIAARHIKKGEELTVSYRQVADVNPPLELAPALPFNFGQLIPEGVDISWCSNNQKAEIVEWLFLQNFPNLVDTWPLRHFRHAGMYTRELTIPAGNVATGVVHKDDHMVVMTKGDITIMTDEGMQRLQAPYIATVKAGIKRVCYAHEETIWATVHSVPGVESMSIEDIEALLFDRGDISWVANLMQGELICQQQ